VATSRSVGVADPAIAGTEPDVDDGQAGIWLFVVTVIKVTSLHAFGGSGLEVPDSTGQRRRHPKGDRSTTRLDGWG
jgi:hypothetical protein